MDLSGKYSDLINDDSLINVLNELDEIDIGDVNQSEQQEHNLPPSDKNLKTQTLSINSTRYDSDSSSVALGEEQYTKQPIQWSSYQKKFDLHISKTLTPLVRYMLETKVNTAGKESYFTKKKTYLEHLINETVESYRHNWNDVYSSVRNGSDHITVEQPEVEKGSAYEELDKDHLKIFKGLSSFDMNSFVRSTSVLSGYDTEGVPTQEAVMNDVFVESGCRHELVEKLYVNGMEEFYSLLDFLFGLVQNTKHDYKVVQTMDLLNTMLKLMPELSVLLALPIKKDSKLLCKGKCYFKYLVEKLKIRFELNKGSVLEVYKRFLKREFVPFYMNNPYSTGKSGREKLEKNQMGTDNEKNGAAQVSSKSELVVVYVLDRLINLTCVLSERLLEFTNMNLEEDTKSGLLKKIKKFLFLPFLGVGMFHELFLPFTANLRFKEVKSVGYRSIIAQFLYPPPPLYSLRLRVLEVLEMITGSNLVRYRGNFHRANRRLTESEPVSGMSQKVERVLINYLHLLSFGAGFLLMGEFMKKSVESPATFFGNYLVLMPHFRINFAQINHALVIEENVYRIQSSALKFLSNLNDCGVFTNDDFMNVRCVNLTQSNTLKRVLSLLVHYVSNTTDSEVEEAEMDLNIDNEFNMSKLMDQNCSKYCDLIVPYNTSAIAAYLLNVTSRQGRGSRAYANTKIDTYSMDRDAEDYECDSSMFYYNDYGKLSAIQVDVCNFEEFDKITRNSLNPSSYYIPLEYSRELKYKLSDRPLVEFKARSTTARVSNAGTGNVLLSSNGFSIHSEYMHPESSNLSSMINRESTIEVDDLAINSEDDTTNREDSMERRSEDCGYVCLLKKHMVGEIRFKQVFELRKELVMHLLETLSSHSPEKLGELEPVYNTFIMKLIY